MCLHAESWSRCLTAEACYHSAHPPPPWYSPPPPLPSFNPHICSCVFAVAASCPQPPRLSFLSLCSGRNTGQGWEGCPVPTLGGSHTPRETRPGVQTHPQTHAQCLVSLFDLHMSLSSSLIHRHTAGLFESFRWGRPWNTAVIVPEVYWFLDLIPAARLFRDENTSTWTLLDASQTPQTPLPLPFTPGLKFLGARADFSRGFKFTKRSTQEQLFQLIFCNFNLCLEIILSHFEF